MREAQRGQVTILTRENGKAVNYDRQLFEYEGQSGADENKVRVAAKGSVWGNFREGGAYALCDITGCRAEAVRVL